MTFKFGKKSIEHMEGVHPTLILAAHYALVNAGVDFGFFEGVRSVAKSQENIDKGTSWLKKAEDSMHCVQKDGYGHGMDLVPYLPVDEIKVVEGVEVKNTVYKNVWDWPACILIAKAVQQYAFANNVAIRWGGVWDIPLNKLTTNLEAEVAAYQVRHAGKDHLDGVHFELPVINNTSDDVKDTAIIA